MQTVFNSEKALEIKEIQCLAVGCDVQMCKETRDKRTEEDRAKKEEKVKREDQDQKLEMLYTRMCTE